MSLVMKDTGGGDFEIVEAGTHLARCYLMAELGHQKTTYLGQEKIVNQVLVSWELVNEKMQDGRPFVISRTYTASLGEKANLRKDLESWRSRPFTEEEAEGFDLKKVLGAPCQITVVHTKPKDKTYANVKAVTAVTKGVTVPDLTNDKVAFELGDELAFAKLPEWIQKKINARVPEPETDERTELQDDDLSALDDLAGQDIPF